MDLLYTIALDEPGSTLQRGLAKVLIGSVLRTGFSGDILVFGNWNLPLYQIPRKAVTEINIDTGDLRGSDLFLLANKLKYGARDFIEAPERYRTILYVDNDCLALKNLEDLCGWREDICWVAEPGTKLSGWQFRGYLTEDEMTASQRPGANAGTFGIRGEKFVEVTGEVLTIWSQPPVLEGEIWGDQPAWNKLLVGGGFSLLCYPDEAVNFPLLHHPNWHEYRKATLLHFCGHSQRAKTELQFAIFVSQFFGEAAEALLTAL